MPKSNIPEATWPQQDIPGQNTPKSTLRWCLLGLILLQWFLFRAYVLREIDWAYPVNHDQTTYLFLSYQYFEILLQNDFLNSLLKIISISNSNGVLLHLQTLPLFLLFGASRLSALSANFLNFALYQVVFALVIKRLTGSQSLALLGIGLLLGTGTPFLWAGGLMDYRLDFAAFCLFGIFISLIIQSDMFNSRKWAVVAGFSAGLLILTRFITTVYLAGIYGLIFGYFLVAELRVQPVQKRFIRVKNIIFSGGVGLIVASPFLWLNRAPIYNYYFILQQGPERFIRAKEVGAENLIDSLLYYPNSIVSDHLTINLFIICLALILLAIGLAYSLAKRPVLLAAVQSSSYSFREAYIFLGACFLIVLGVLTANTAKSQIVGGILIPVLLWLVILTFFLGIKRGLVAATPQVRTIGVIVAVLCLGYGLSHQIANLGKHAAFSLHRPDIKAIEQMYQAIGAYSEQMDWPTSVISTDSTADYLTGKAIGVRYYEAQGVLIDFQQFLGSSIAPVTLESILQQLEHSDFVILTHTQAQSVYPFYESIKAARPQMEAFVKDHFVYLERYNIYGHRVDLYVRPSFKFSSGISGDQITSDQLGLNLPFPVAAAASEIVLGGPLNPWISPETTTISCVLFEGDREVEILAVEFTATTDYYSIHCHLPDTLNLSSKEEVQIKLKFSIHVITEKSNNNDNQQLSVAVPNQNRVVLKPFSER